MNWQNLITIASAAILVGAELFGIAWALGWALAGLFQLGDMVALILEGLFGLMALAALVVFIRSAIRVEPVTRQG